MGKIYDLEDRTLRFSKEIIIMCKKISRDSVTKEIISQLVRSGGSVGANYREANEGISKKDCLHRLRIARKECKETTYWLELMKVNSPETSTKLDWLIDESQQIRNILSAIIKRLS